MKFDNNEMMQAQKLYDLREDFEFCSRSDLSEFFCKEASDPAPSGNIQISRCRASQFIRLQCARIEANTNDTINMDDCRDAMVSK